MKKAILIIALTLVGLTGIEVKSQCAIQQLSDSNGSQPNFGGGQSFIACSTGLLEEVEFKTFTNWANPYSLQIKDNNCNVIWTVSGLSAGTNQIVKVNLSSGSGTTRNVMSGQKYSFGIPGSGHNFRFQVTTNPYPDGGYINQYDNNCNENSIDDLWFRVGIGQVLPVELIEFNGKPIIGGIELRWTTASETSNFGFEIQKSGDGLNWQQIDFMTGMGTTNEMNEYVYQDLNPFSGSTYYQLKQIDLSGEFEYSKVIVVEFSKAESAIRVLPNPSYGKIDIQIDNPLHQKMRLAITDNTGRRIFETDLIDSDESNWQGQINIENHGIYYVAAHVRKKIYLERVVVMDENGK